MFTEVKMAGIINSEAILNECLKTAENVIIHFDDEKEKRNKVLGDLQETLKKTYIHVEKFKKVTDTVKEIVNNVDINSDSDEVLKMYRDKRKELTDYNPDMSNHSNLTEYCRQVKAIVDNADGTGRAVIDDDDIEMTQDDINIIDPFTKKRMTDPVKNKVCGHVYDRESVTTVLKINKNTRCPVVGCINKAAVLLENLIADIVTRRYLHDNPA